MKIKYLTMMVSTLGLLAGPFHSGIAQEVFSGWLEDYSGFEQQRERVFMYQTAEGVEVLARYEAIMIDQPEIIVAPTSKVQGVKPDDMKLIADTLRAVLVGQLERSNYRLVTTPGPETLFLRPAMTDLHLKKKRKRIVQFTPIGLVATLATTPFKDVMDKIDLQQVTLEIELLDSQTEDRLGAFIEKAGSATKKKEWTSWDEFLTHLEVSGGRLACRLNNTSLADNARTDCELEYPF